MSDDDSRDDLTRLLAEWQGGDGRALEELMASLYQALRTLAAQKMSQERRSHSWQPTDLVNELYLRLRQQMFKVDFQDRNHFLALSARSMKQILIDHARKRTAAKRGGGKPTVELSDPIDLSFEVASLVLTIQNGIETFRKLEPKKALALELRFYGGLTHKELAEQLEISPPTVKRYLNAARAFLRLYLEDNATQAPMPS